MAGCNTAPPSDASFTPARDTTVPLTSSTRFDPARFQGRWYEIEGTSPVIHGGGCVSSVFQFVSARPEVFDGQSADPSCPVSEDSNFQRMLYQPFRYEGLGRFKSTKSFIDEYWVLWVDEDHRTMAIGTESGRFGYILNRTSTLRADRLQAAREVLAFNGYDLTRLERPNR